MSADAPVPTLLENRGQQGSTPASPMAIQKEANGLCNFCADLKLSAQDFKGSRDAVSKERRSSFQKVILPAVHVIKDQGCTFCNFIVTEMINSSDDPLRWDGSAPSSLDNLQLSVEWIKDGRRLQESDPASPSTRRLRITANDETLPDAYLVLMVSDESCEQFLGRMVDASTIDISRLQRWLTTCRHSHQGCHHTPDNSAIDRLFSNHFFKLIDVDKKCIVSVEAQPFFALSYVWGPIAHMFMASKENIKDLMQPGGLSLAASQLPRTMKDAMLLTELLGYRYLWIDALCITQDDRDDLISNLRTMDAVYAHATLTICAGSGDASFGIPGLTQGSRNFQQAIVCYSEDVQLMVTRPTEHYIQRSRWNTRAWTFQERICSRRSLIFVDDRVFYQCRQSVMCEDITMENDNLLEDWSLETKYSLGRLFNENPIRQYTTCVQLYTQRKLTHSGDKLVAFFAIEMLLSQSINTGFQMGLPVSYFDFALLWTPIQSPGHFSKRISQFPSWTWAGWERGSEYSHSTIEGVLSNMHEWLCTRTWIEWYVVDTLHKEALVWDGNRSGLPGRWKGYAAPNGLSSYGRVSTSGLGVPDQILKPLPTQAGQLPLSDAYYRPSSSIKLRFDTHSAFFAVDPIPPNKHSQHDPYDVPQWHSVFDVEGDWCGTVLLDQAWIDNGETAVYEHPDKDSSVQESSLYTPTRREYKFIAISEARELSIVEHDSWTYYVPTDRLDSQWDLYYVLLIVTSADGISERRGLGKVFKDAFKKSYQPGYSWSQILLG